MRRNPEAAFQMSRRELMERVAGMEVPPPQIQREADCALASGDRYAEFINGKMATRGCTSYWERSAGWASWA